MDYGCNISSVPAHLEGGCDRSHRNRKRGPELWEIRRSTRPAPTLPPVSGGPTSVDRAPLPDAGRAENPHRRREERAPSPAVAGQPLPTLETHPVRTVVWLRGT